MWNVNLLYQFKPVLFYNTPDFSQNILYLFNIPKQVVNNGFLQLSLDVVFLLSNIFLLISVKYNFKYGTSISILVAFINLGYSLLCQTFTSLSWQGFSCWFWMPFLFCSKTQQGFYFGLQSIRYLFLLFFFSAAIWKIRTGAIFNIEQMRGVLALQHSVYLTSSTSDFFSNFIIFLLQHKWLCYFLYLGATLIELMFVIGFFTRKFDKLLIVLFLLFVTFDFLLMQINYFSWIAYLPCLWYSKKVVFAKS
jgi:hypothetical protein